MKRYTHPISAIALLLLVLAMLASACTRSEGGEGESTASGDGEKVITSGQLGTEPFTSTAETTVMTPAQTTEAPVTSDAPVTTEPTTSEAPVTTTTAPITTTKAPVTTTKAPVTTTTTPVTTTTTASHTHTFGPWTLCDDYINEIRTCACGESEKQVYNATEADTRLIADRVIYYINQYRAEEGNPTATKLDRLTLVAEMRSEQLTTNYAHDTGDERECYAYYQYGEYIDPSEWGSDRAAYYSAPVGEAIAATGGGFFLNTIDDVAMEIATAWYESSGHWRYVGGGSPYIAVGISYSPTSTYEWYACCFVTDTAQYE